jgi:hypothetical protein
MKNMPWPQAKLEPTFNANASLTSLLVAVEKEGDSLLQPTKVGPSQ